MNAEQSGNNLQRKLTPLFEQTSDHLIQNEVLNRLLSRSHGRPQRQQLCFRHRYLRRHWLRIERPDWSQHLGQHLRDLAGRVQVLQDYDLGWTTPDGILLRPGRLRQPP